MEHHSCSGCSLCLLVCPVWRETRDVRLTPKGRAKAVQHGATQDEIAASVAGCTLCGACEPACPEDLPLVDMMMALRRTVPLPARPSFSQKLFTSRHVLLAGRTLGRDDTRRQRTLALLGPGFELAADEGFDIVAALEAGQEVTGERLEAFIESFRDCRRLVVAEGLLIKPLRQWLPRTEVISLGMALSPRMKSKIGRGDLYVIESRAFNGDHARLVRHYDALRRDSGCHMNLDLQRIAVPAQGSEAQARWILEGRTVERIVVEDLGDVPAFSFAGPPVVHVADL